MNVLVLRPEPAATTTAKKLEALGHTSILFSMTKRECLKHPDVKKLTNASGLILTSANAVRCLEAFFEENKSLLEKDAYVVGSRTKEILETIGFTSIKLVAKNGIALAQMMIDGEKTYLSEVSKNKPLAYLTAEVRTPDLENLLVDRDIKIEAYHVYEMISEFSPSEFKNAIGKRKIDTVLFYAKSSAQLFFKEISDTELGLFTSTRFACLSKEIAMIIPDKFSTQIDIATEPDEHHLLACIDR